MAPAGAAPPAFADAAAFQATLYQCSACRHTGTIKCNVQTHVRRHCPGATCVEERRWIAHSAREPQARPQGAQGTQVTIGDVSGTVNVVTINGPVTIVAARTGEENDAIVEEVFRNPALLRQLVDSQHVQDAPGALFEHTKGARGPARLRNVEVRRDKVAETHADGTKETTTCAAFARDVLPELLTILVSIASLASGSTKHGTAVRSRAKTLLEKLKCTHRGPRHKVGKEMTSGRVHTIESAAKLYKTSRIAFAHEVAPEPRATVVAMVRGLTAALRNCDRARGERRDR